jgi:hypothetical protein
VDVAADEEHVPEQIDLVDSLYLHVPSIAVCADIDPYKPWLHERLPKLFGISVVRR